MVNTNGKIQEAEENSFVKNRGFLYGDAVFETIKVVKGKILFFEDHYFRLMSGMRIVRMRIPNSFTMENIESEVKRTIKSNDLTDGIARVRVTIYRDAEGLYTPKSNGVKYVIQVSELDTLAYQVSERSYEVDLYKDFYVSAQLLSNVKTTNRVMNVMASIFAQENDYDNCLMINDKKMVVEAINGNIFIVKDNVLITPPLSEGCIKGVMRKQIIEAAKLIPDLEVEEVAVSPFDLQKSDEVFITNIIQGIQPVTKYRKKVYSNQIAKQLIDKVNQLNGLVI